jgi:hypothetical protein
MTPSPARDRPAGRAYEDLKNLAKSQGRPRQPATPAALKRRPRPSAV